MPELIKRFFKTKLWHKIEYRDSSIMVVYFLCGRSAPCAGKYGIKARPGDDEYCWQCHVKEQAEASPVRKNALESQPDETLS